MQESTAPLDVLVVDDEVSIRRTLTFCLEDFGHRVVAVGNVGDARDAVARAAFDLIFLDLRIGSSNGLDLIPEFRSLIPQAKIVVITAHASIDTAVESIRLGATDYLAKPFTPAQVGIQVDKVLHLRALERQVRELRGRLAASNMGGLMESRSPAMKRILALAEQAAASEATILITGESGTGKTALARAIHAWSPRLKHPFVVVSCPSMSAELLEAELFGHVKGAFTGALRDNLGRVAQAAGGTLFLDEIGDLPLSLQPKLLRFIQDREYERVGDPQTRRADVRVIAATNRDLSEAVREGRFREDLYYRLNVIELRMPPLRERRGDILPLAEHFLVDFRTRYSRPVFGFTDEAIAQLLSYVWPGNVRELRNAVERAVVLAVGEQIGPESLPFSQPKSRQIEIGDPVPLAEIEEAHIRLLLSTGRSFEETASILGIDQATLWRRRKQYGI